MSLKCVRECIIIYMIYRYNVSVFEKISIYVIENVIRMYGNVRRKWACMRKECKTDMDICI